MKNFIRAEKKRIRLGTCIRIARTKAGYTQVELGGMIGMAQNNISALERSANASYTTLLKVVDALDITFGELLDN
jgi:transcriptional regulator with XRE-family HTH domain